MKTKEYDEAVRLYNSSISLDANEPTTYCNRALAYIKMKKFEKGLEDCNTSIRLKNDYSKAYYRRAICLISLKKFNEAYEDLLSLLNEAPTNEEILTEIQNTKEKWSEHVGELEWKNIQGKVEEDFNLAKSKKYVKKVGVHLTTENKPIPKETTQAPPKTSNSGGFKKIKIVEDDEETSKPKEVPVVEQEISPHMSKINI